MKRKTSLKRYPHRSFFEEEKIVFLLNHVKIHVISVKFVLTKMDI